MYHRLRVQVFIIFFLAFAGVMTGQLSIVTSTVVAQTPSNYSLVIEGEELQNCIITVRYFRNRQLTKTVVSRSTLAGGRAEEPLEDQHDGMEVIIQSAEIPLSAKILGKEKVLADEKTDKSGLAKLALGKVGRAPFQPISVQLSKAENSLIESIATAMANGTSASSLVSDSPEANIDGYCLDVFLRELKRLIGEPQDAESSMKGWLGYGKTNASRTLVGVIKCKNGVCGFKALLDKGKLLDLIPNCQSLIDNYFQEPIELKNYIQQAKVLTQSLFAGNAEKAHSLYSPKFQSQVTTEQLKELCDLVQQRYGKSVESIEFKRSHLQDYNFEQQNYLLNIDMVLQTDTGARCISRTAFNIPSGRNQIGKAHLGAINVFQVYQSSHPKHAETTSQLLADLSDGIKIDSFLSLFPEELQKLAKKEEIEATLSRIAKFLNGVPPELDFDLWNVTGTDEIVSASGPVKFGSDDCFAELQLNSQNQLIGISFHGPALSESTLGSFEFDHRLKQTAETFWTYLLKEDSEAAYQMLHPEFQEQFPLAEMKAQLESPQTETSPLKRIVTDTVRLSSNPFRPEPYMVTVYLTADFEEGEPIQATCELPLLLPEEASKGVIFDYSNELDADFPVATIPAGALGKDGLQTIVEAFVEYDSKKLLDLIDPAARSSIDEMALIAYFKKLAEIGGKMSSPKSLSRTVDYSVGMKRFRGNAILVSENGEPLHVEGWFRSGFLERFSITDPRLIDFVDLIEDTSEVERRIDSFVRSWLNGGSDVGDYLLPSIRSEAMLKSLEGLRASFEAEYGQLASISSPRKQSFRGGGTLLYEVTLTGVEGTKDITISADVGAFGGLISGITF